MKSVAHRIGLLTAFWFALTSCADQQSSAARLAGSNPQFTTANPQLQLLSSNRFTVVDENGQPLTGATILVGFETGNPFQGNELTTDAAGVAEVPADWKAALPITVQAPGYVTMTLPTVQPGDVRLSMSKTEGQSKFTVGGTPAGYGRIVTDGKVDFALMIPAMSRQNLLSFDLSAVISPETDRITVVGKNVDLPSNIALPRQTENYIFPITLDKPAYRVVVRDSGRYVISATHGQFPMQKVVNEIRDGKSMFDVINLFTFSEGGLASVDVNGANVAGVDIPVNQTKFTGGVTVTAPNYAAGNVMIALAASEKDGLLAPSDLKRLTPGQSMALKTDAASPTRVLSLLMENAAAILPDALRQFFAPWLQLKEQAAQPMAVQPQAAYNFNRLSFALDDGAAGVSPQFLPLINPPTVNGGVITLDVPAAPSGLAPIATYLVYSEIESVGTGKTKSERRTRLWEIRARSWLPQVELPQLNFTRRPDRTYRWEVLFLAGPSNLVGSGADEAVDLNTVTHVTRNATDI